MANTVIAVRSSGTAAATPSLGVIANGEIALNFADGIIYYKTSSNTLGSIRTTQPAGLTTEVQFNDAGSFGANSGFTFSKVTGVLTVKSISLTTPLAFSSGGANAVSYTTGAFLTSNGTAFVSVANTGTAGTYANASYVPVITTDAYGRVSAVTNTAVAIDTAAITSGTLAVARGGTGVTTSTGTGAVVLNTAPTLTLPTINNIKQGYSTTATAVGTTTLTVNSNYLQFFTGTTTQTLALPAPQTMTLGMGFFVVNNSTGAISVIASNSAPVTTIPAGTSVLIVSIDLTAGNGAAGWSVEFVGFSSAVLPFGNGGSNNTTYTTGAILTSNGTAFVALANTGTAGTYANATHVPVITTDAYGRVSAVTNTAIQAASTSVAGIAQLNDTITSTSTTQAATANSVKTAYTTASGDAVALAIALG